MIIGAINWREVIQVYQDLLNSLLHRHEEDFTLLLKAVSHPSSHGYLGYSYAPLMVQLRI